MPLSANRRSAPQRGAESMGGLRLTCTWGHLQQTYNTQSLKHNHANVLCLGKTFTRNRLGKDTELAVDDAHAVRPVDDILDCEPQFRGALEATLIAFANGRRTARTPVCTRLATSTAGLMKTASSA